MKRVRAVLLFGSALAVAACVPRREPPPPSPPQPREVPSPAKPIPAPPPRTSWQDLPLTAGNWSYRTDGLGSVASFGPPNAQARFTVRCDRTRRQVMLSVPGGGNGSIMTVRTSSSARNFALAAQGQPVNALSATLPASDRFLDAIAFSRGRFAVEVPGTAMLVIPAWPEPARVVEDCRS